MSWCITDSSQCFQHCFHLVLSAQPLLQPPPTIRPSQPPSHLTQPQCGYQTMLDEALAIVMAPTDRIKKCGIFRLSTPGGLTLVQRCGHTLDTLFCLVSGLVCWDPKLVLVRTCALAVAMMGMCGGCVGHAGLHTVGVTTSLNGMCSLHVTCLARAGLGVFKQVASLHGNDRMASFT